MGDVVLWAVALIATVALAIGLWRWPRPPSKRLVFRSDAVPFVTRRLGSSSPFAVPYELALTFNGEPVPRCSSTVVTLENTGRQPILSEEIRSDIRFRIHASRLLRSVTVNESHSRIEATVAADGEAHDGDVECTLSFNYLEPGDSIEIQLLHDGPAEAVTAVEGNVAGARDGIVRDRREERASRLQGAALFAAAGAAATFFVVALVNGWLTTDDPPAALPPGSPSVSAVECDGQVAFGEAETSVGRKPASLVLRTFEGERCALVYDLDRGWDDMGANLLTSDCESDLVDAPSPALTIAVDGEVQAFDTSTETGERLSIDLFDARTMRIAIAEGAPANCEVVLHTIDFDERPADF